MSPGLRDASRRLRTLLRRSGTGWSRNSPAGCCGLSGSGRPIRTGPRSVTSREAPRLPGAELQSRYTTAELGVFTSEEARRFVRSGSGDPQQDITLAWELLYRLEPELYDRLTAAERLHPGVVGWLPRGVDQIAEVGAGTGRLTVDLIERGQHVVAIEPALPLRQILRRKLVATGHGSRARVTGGFFDRLPL